MNEMLNKSYKSLGDSLDATRARLDEIAEQYDIWMPETMPEGIRHEFNRLTEAENRIGRAISSLPLQTDIDALNDPNYND